MLEAKPVVFDLEKFLVKKQQFSGTLLAARCQLFFGVRKDFFQMLH